MVRAIIGSNNNPAITNALLEAGADVKARNIAGETPLHLAARSRSDNKAVIISTLIEAGAEKNT